MAYENIIVETRGHVGLVTLNRPKALNALNQALIEELNAALTVFDADPEIGCTVITGSEKAFAAGADVKEMAEKTFVDAFLGGFLERCHGGIMGMRRRIIGRRVLIIRFFYQIGSGDGGWKRCRFVGKASADRIGNALRCIEGRDRDHR